MQESSHEHKNIRMGGCKDTSKYTRNQGYEDMRMQGYKQVRHFKHVDYF